MTLVWLGNAILSWVISGVQIAVQGSTPPASVTWTVVDVINLLHGFVGWGLWIAWLSTGAWHVRCLAEVLGDRVLVGRAKRLIWLGPVLNTVGLATCFVGPLISLILLYNVLTRVRKLTLAFEMPEDGVAPA